MASAGCEGRAMDIGDVTVGDLIFSVLVSPDSIQLSIEMLPLKILMLTQKDANYHLPTGLNVKPQVLNFIPYVCEQACQMAGQLIYFCKV